jgi:hypothetical protein
MKSKIIGLLVFVFCGFLFFNAGILFHRKYDGHLMIEWVKTPISNIQRKIKAWQSTAETISIKIETKEAKKLEKYRNEAIAEGYLLQDMQKEVPCFIIYKADTLSAKIRLKGNAEDHFKFDKVSYRIQLDDDKTIFGVNEFSLQNPRIRNYAHEWFIHKWLKAVDILTLKYEFIDLKINDENKGVYAFEEHFSKQLIEKNKNRLGIILRFDEEHYLDKIKHGIDELDIDYKSAPIQAYSLKTILKSPELTKQYNNAINILQQFRLGNLPVNKVLDIEKWANYCAILDICNGTESYFFWPNTRLYYNPITSKLEPIGYSYERSQDEEDKTFLLDALRAEKYPQYEFAYSLLQDSLFLKAYAKALNKYTKPNVLENFYKSINDELNQKLAILDKEYMNDFRFNFDSYLKKRDYLSFQLKPERGLIAYLKEIKPDSLILQIACTHRIAAVLDNLYYKDSLLNVFHSKTIYPALNKNNFPDFIQVSIPVSLAKISNKKNYQTKFKIQYKIQNQDSTLVCDVLPYPYINEALIKNDIIRNVNNYKNFDFIKIDEKNKKIEILTGKHNINETLIFPENYTVSAFPGTNLILNNNAMIISYAPFIFLGNEENPITINGNLKNSGNGIIIYNKDKYTEFKHVIFNQLDNPETKAWSISGAVNIYSGKVNFYNCTFTNNNCEDALNTIRARVTLYNCTFKNIYADAYDSDFCNGIISNCVFANCKNDALDFSGSMFSIDKVNIENIADKALSAGEASEINAKNIKLNNCELGFTSKDLSNLTVENAEIYNTKVVYIAFTKKNEFGASSINAKNINIHTSPKYEALISKDCSLKINDKLYKKYTEDVFDMLYGNELGVKSK